MYQFKSTLASYYNELAKEILTTVLNSNVIHIDEFPCRVSTGSLNVLGDRLALG